MKTFFWHDYETFGRHPGWDKVAQFAGIRTDMDLNPVGKPVVKYCKLPNDYLPRPGACLVTSITPQIVAQKGVTEARLAKTIHKELSQPDTCSIGYNSISFDDEFTRNILYRNFYDPYEHHSVKGNSRWDLIDVVRLVRALRPGGISWPKKDDGSFSTKLEHLTRANGIEHDAHDALADVKATIAIARIIKEKKSKLYEYTWKHRTKKAIKKMLCVAGNNRIRDAKPLLYVSPIFSAEKNCISVVLPVAVDAERSNNIIVVDLLSDLTSLIELESTDAIREKVFTSNKNLPEGESRIPLHCVSANKCPVFVEMSALKPDDADRLGFDMDLCRENIRLLRSHNDIEIVARHVYGPYRDIDRDPELAIYDRFLSRQERTVLPEFREADPSDLSDYEFNDPRMSALTFRYKARNFPKALDDGEIARWELHRHQRLTKPLPIGKDQSSLVFTSYFEELELRLKDPELDSTKRGVLQKLQQYGKKLEKSLKVEVGSS